MPSPNRRVVVIQPDLWEEIEGRQRGKLSPAKVLDAMLRRYLEVIVTVGDGLRERFTAEELDRMAALVTAPGYRDLARQVERERFRHPGDDALDLLAEKVSELSVAERMALTDQLERRLPVASASGVDGASAR